MVAILLAVALSPVSLASRDISLGTTSGKTVRPLAKTGKPATAFVFILSECPNANAYAPEINRIAASYGKKGVSFSVVMVDPSLAVADAARHARDYKFTAPVLLDPKLRLAAVSAAKVSPTAAVYDRSMRLVYSGRIDDLFYAPGRRRPIARSHDFRAALDAVLAGKQVKAARTPAVGCVLSNPSR